MYAAETVQGGNLGRSMTDAEALEALQTFRSIVGSDKPYAHVFADVVPGESKSGSSGAVDRTHAVIMGALYEHMMDAAAQAMGGSPGDYFKTVYPTPADALPAQERAEFLKDGTIFYLGTGAALRAQIDGYIKVLEGRIKPTAASTASNAVPEAKKPWLLYGGIGLGAAAALGVGWMLLKPKKSS